MVRMVMEVSNGKLVTRHTWLAVRVVSFSFLKYEFIQLRQQDWKVGVGGGKTVTKMDNVLSLFATGLITWRGGDGRHK